MSEELKPCPFCGSSDIDLWPLDGYKSPCCIMCGATIEANFETGNDTDKQIAAWNRRPE